MTGRSGPSGGGGRTIVRLGAMTFPTRTGCPRDSTRDPPLRPARTLDEAAGDRLVPVAREERGAVEADPEADLHVEVGGGRRRGAIGLDQDLGAARPQPVD